MAVTTATADTHLVPVLVEHIALSGMEPTLERVRGALQKLFVAGAPPAPDRAADLTPVAAQLLAVAAAPGLARRAAPRALLLKEVDGERGLPIVIGVAEAEVLAMHLQGHTTPRPLSYDLMRSLLEAGGLRVYQAAVLRLEGDTFFATVTLQTPDGRPVDLDARPSDAINLALRTGAPVYVAAGLLMTPEASEHFLERFETRFEGAGTGLRATPPAQSAATGRPRGRHARRPQPAAAPFTDHTSRERSSSGETSRRRWARRPLRRRRPGAQPGRTALVSPQAGRMPQGSWRCCVAR